MSDDSSHRGWFQVSLKSVLLLMVGVGIYLAARYPATPRRPERKGFLDAALQPGDRLYVYQSNEHGGSNLRLAPGGSYEVVEIGSDYLRVRSDSQERIIPVNKITSIYGERQKPPAPRAPVPTSAALGGDSQ